MSGEIDLSPGSASKHPVASLVAFGQVGFAVFIGLCVVLHPGYVIKANEGGISNFGVHLKTVVPYSLALVLPAGLTYRASRLIDASSDPLGYLRTVLRFYSVLILLTLLTTYTYKIDTAFRDLHVGVGVVITIFELGASLWMYRELRALVAVLSLELVGFVLATLTIFGALHLLFATQMLSGVAFAILLVQTCRVLTTPSR
ncbi:MAG: hypothetical protein WAK12_06295 [Acidimicrobiales bacterium]